MKNLSCIIFINKKLREFSFNSLRFDGDYYYLPKEYFGTKTDLVLPITKKQDEWWICQINCGTEIAPVKEPTAIQDTVADISDSGLPSSDLETTAESITKIGVKIFGSSLKEKLIENNDYILVENFEDNVLFNILFLENSTLDLNGKMYRLTDDTITIGRAEDSVICVKANESVSRIHAIIAKDKNGNYRIEAAKGKANFYINGAQERSYKLCVGDTIQIFNTKILFLKNEICIYGGASTKLKETNGLSLTPVIREKVKKNWFIRTPRIISGFRTEPMEIDLPPPSQKVKPMPAILTIGPSLTMSMVMLVTLGVTIGNFTAGAPITSIISSGALAFSMLLGAILWPTLTRKYQKKVSRQSEALRVNSYNEYIDDLKKELEKDNMNNRKLLNEVFLPSPETISAIIKDEKFSRRTFEKTDTDNDYLAVRLGSGKVPSNIEIKIPKKGFNLDRDLLLKLPYEIEEGFKEMNNMPVSVSLKENKTLGIIGDQAHIDNLIKSFFMSLTFGHSYDEVKTVFIYRNDQKSKFEEFKKSLHTKTDDEDYRLIATTKEEVHGLFGYISELIEQQRQTEKEKNQRYPFFVFFIFDRDLVEDEPFLKKLVKPEEEDNFCSLFIYKSIFKLPKECKIIIQADNEKCGYFSREDNTNKFQDFMLDKITDTIFIDYIKYLQNIRIKLDALGAGISNRVSFLGLYKAGSVEGLNIKKRWEENRAYKSLAAPIGIKAGGGVFSLDMHENFHGPHGLAAGMTGSGKSELLQTLILSLAVNYNPNDVSFILIDFKGGGMANVFDNLPHLAGKITNLSGSALRRSLISIDAEKERRQSIFKATGVNSIDQYQKLSKNAGLRPLPHLIIIVDEFAQLKSQQPDFMRKIIDIAQIGRSLGIHLLLATQKPTGVVDDQIWGNSRFRMCLKVLEKQDSHEMIKKPDAAFIKLPGRCYVQVGYDEVYESIQSGYSGAPYIPVDEYQDEEDNVLMSVDSFGTAQKVCKLKGSAAKEEKTQLEALVSHFDDIAKEERLNPNLLWLEPLKEKIYLEDIDDNAAGFNGQAWVSDECILSVCVGFADFPETREQKPLKLNLASGNVAVYGISASGKTTFLQTALLNLSMKNKPENLNYFIFDFGSRVLSCFDKMPHTRAVCFSDDSEKIQRAMETLMQTMAERQKMFGQKGVASFESYNANTATKIPAVVIVIDNYSVVTERYASMMGDNLIKLAREGMTYGIYLLLTGSNKSSIFYRVSDFINNNFALKQTELIAFRDILKVPVQVEPDENPGRGLTVISKKVVEFQTALSVKFNDEAARTQAIRTIAEQMQKAAGKKSEANKKAIEKAAEEKPPEIKNKSLELSLNSKNCLVFNKKSLKLYGLELKTFKTLIATDFDDEKAFEIMQILLENLLKSETNSGIFVFDTSDKYVSTDKKVKCYKCGNLSEGIKALKKQTDKVIIFIYGVKKFYDLITDEDADFLTDFSVYDTGNKSNYILFDGAGNLNTMTLTPFMNNLTKNKKLNCFLIGNKISALNESVFEEIVKGRKFTENSGKMCIVNRSQAESLEIARLK